MSHSALCSLWLYGAACQVSVVILDSGKCELRHILVFADARLYLYEKTVTTDWYREEIWSVPSRPCRL